MSLKYKIVFTFGLLMLLFQGGCGLFSIYEIQGTWKIEKDINGEKTILVAEFTGSRDTGTIFVDANTYGDYLVNFDDDLTFIISYFEPGSFTTDRRDTFKGGFDGKDNMKGTVEVVDVDAGIHLTGVWTAVKQSKF